MLILVMTKPKHPLAYDDEPVDQGPGNLYARLFCPLCCHLILAVQFLWN